MMVAGAAELAGSGEMVGAGLPSMPAADVIATTMAAGGLSFQGAGLDGG